MAGIRCNPTIGVAPLSLFQAVSPVFLRVCFDQSKGIFIRGPRQNKQSGFVLERRHSTVIDACRLRRAERYKACVDDMPLDCPSTAMGGEDLIKAKCHSATALHNRGNPNTIFVLCCSYAAGMKDTVIAVRKSGANGIARLRIYCFFKVNCTGNFAAVQIHRAASVE